MRIKSPLANFTDVLGQIRDSAELYSDTLRINESSSRAVLIDPILRILGWDTGNPFMVEVEKPIDKGRVDYALYDVNQEIRIIVEAKKLGTDLMDKEIFLSVVRYAFSSDVSDIFLTDGLTWHHFTDFEPGRRDPNKILSLMDDDLVEVAAYLVQRLDAARYWPEDKDVDELSQQINQIESEMSKLQGQLAKLQFESKIVATPVLEPDSDIKEKLVSDQGSFVSLGEIGLATRTKPTLLVLPDRTQVSIRTWTDLLTHCCRFAMDNNPNIPIPFKDAVGKKINLLSPVRPPRGITYFETDYHGQQIFVYTNYDSNNCIRNSLHILKQTPSDIREVESAVIFN